jgi:hypothetical protein
MGCCLIVGVLAGSPRLIVFGMWFFTDYLTHAGIDFVWGLLGFLFAPCTTIAYAIAQNSLGGLDGWGAVVFALGIVADVLIYYGGRRSRAAYSHD